MSSPTADRPVTVPQVRGRKRRDGAEPLVMVTAYDEPSARIVDAAGVDVLLVGDSVANNVLGYEDTLHVTIDDMVRHVAAVSRARPRCLVVGDMPWMSYHLTVHDAVRNAAALVRAGAGAVKLEGGRSRLAVIEAIVAAEIPVMGHIGLTPQSVLAMGGYRVQARSADAAGPAGRRGEGPVGGGGLRHRARGRPRPGGRHRDRGHRRAHHRHRGRPRLRRAGAGLPRPLGPGLAHPTQVRPPVRGPGRAWRPGPSPPSWPTSATVPSPPTPRATTPPRTCATPWRPTRSTDPPDPPGGALEPGASPGDYHRAVDRRPGCRPAEARTLPRSTGPGRTAARSGGR